MVMKTVLGEIQEDVIEDFKKNVYGDSYAINEYNPLCS